MKMLNKKRSEAEQRAEARVNRGDKQQLKDLIAGGHAHSREAARLTNKIAEELQLKKATSKK